jgi:hypothetical protein
LPSEGRCEQGSNLEGNACFILTSSWKVRSSHAGNSALPEKYAALNALSSLLMENISSNHGGNSCLVFPEKYSSNDEGCLDTDNSCLSSPAHGECAGVVQGTHALILENISSNVKENSCCLFPCAWLASAAVMKGTDGGPGVQDPHTLSGDLMAGDRSPATSQELLSSHLDSSASADKLGGAGLTPLR